MHGSLASIAWCSGTFRTHLVTGGGAERTQVREAISFGFLSHLARVMIHWWTGDYLPFSTDAVLSVVLATLFSINIHNNKAQVVALIYSLWLNSQFSWIWYCLIYTWFELLLRRKLIAKSWSISQAIKTQ